MSTSEQQGEPQLTRKQLREIRMTGSTPVIGPDGPIFPRPAETVDDDSHDEGVDDVASFVQPVSAARTESAPIQTPEPAAAVPPVVAAPVADSAVDLGVAPLTRRQARQQELIRTASVPVITPAVLAEHAAAEQTASEQKVDVVEAEVVETDGEVVETEAADASEVHDAPPILNPGFGSELLAGTDSVILPASFDQLINRATTSTGSVSTPSALILSQASTGGSPIIAPVNATGELLITGSFDLPEGLGSTGHALGATDGNDADAALLDREIPASSSPAPIAASAAISTIKGNAEIIRPPAPEKGSRLMLTLAITAGALALALVGVLILAFITGAL